MSDILIIADRAGEQQVALSRGLSLAGKLGCGVHVAAFCYESLRSLGITNPRRQAMARKRLEAHRKREVETRLRVLRPASVRASLSVAWEKNIHEWLIKVCAKRKFEAVVKTGHRSETFFYTPTDWHLLRECAAPVMICADKKWRRTVPVIAAVDLGSGRRSKRALNRRIIDTARCYAMALESELYVIHAIRISPVLRELDLVDAREHANAARVALRPEIKKLAKLYDIPVNRFLLKQGPADKVITSEAARLKAQLLVMGNGGRTGAHAALMGNTAESVLVRARTDVLAIKGA